MRFAVVSHRGQKRLAVVRGASVALLSPDHGALCDLAALSRSDAPALVALASEADGLPPSAWLPWAQVEFALPFERAGKVVCLGLNYAEHAREGGREPPDYPSLFLRTSSSLVAAEQAMVCPSVSDKFDYEAELLVVIGRGGHRIAEQDALGHVFGYTCFNDGSLRDYQRKTAQWTAGKNFDKTGAIGPAIVTADELPPGADGLRIASRINGRPLQDANTSQMLVSVAKAIEIISEIMTLESGDLIAMGTPSGVGYPRTPPVFMKHGDVVEIEIERIGVLRNPVVGEALQGKEA